MTIRDRLKKEISRMLKYTNNPQVRSKLGFLIQKVDSMSDSEANALYNEITKASDNQCS